jgi:hypothetical protein
MRKVVFGLVAVAVSFAVTIMALPVTAGAADAVAGQGIDILGWAKGANETIALSVASIVAVLGMIKFALKVVSIWIGDKDTKAALEATVGEIDKLKTTVDMVPDLSVAKPARIVTDGMRRWEADAKPGAVAKLKEAITAVRNK